MKSSRQRPARRCDRRRDRHDVRVQPFYSRRGEHAFTSQSSTAGPWGPDSQHGGPPAALLTSEIERLEPGRTVGRLTMELLGPVPVGPLSTTASVVRPGRSVALCEATLYDEQGGRSVARASAWMFPTGEAGPRQDDEPLRHGPADGEPHPRPRAWSGGYLDAVEWRWVAGSVEEPGPGVVWMRPRVDLVEGEPTTPIQRLMVCVDSASGVSAALDPGRWAFLNTELTVHVLRPPVGDWVCLDARTTLGSGHVGLATADVYDERGLVARSAQALLVARR
jgi:hypothetical protein